MQPVVTVLIVGDEILTAEVADENGTHLLRTLAGTGARVRELRVLPDERTALVEALCEAVAASDLVLVTGGIGPTHDDCTRPAVAEALGVPLETHEAALERLRSGRRRPLTPDDAAMAKLPRGSELLTSTRVPGFGFRAGRIIALPGVPHLLRGLLEEHRGLVAGRPWVRREVISGLREGQIASPLRDLAASWPSVRWGSYPKFVDPGWTLTLVLRAADEETADAAETALRDMLAGLSPPRS